MRFIRKFRAQQGAATSGGAKTTSKPAPKFKYGTKFNPNTGLFLNLRFSDSHAPSYAIIMKNNYSMNYLPDIN